jgi:hypothetical protein
VVKVGIAEEDGVTVQEVFTSPRARVYNEVVDGLIPGATLLVRTSCRILLATTQNVYLFRGGHYDRPGAQLGVYSIDRGGFSFGEDSVTLPGGEMLYMDRTEVAAVASALSVDDYRELAVAAAREAGIQEIALTVARATEPKPRKKTIGTKAFDFVLGGGELDFRDDVIRLIVLVTDQRIYVFDGQHLMRPGQLLAAYARNASEGLSEGRAMTLPDGRTMTLAHGDRVRVLTALKQ